MDKCFRCNKKLRELKNIVDWKGRKYHKKCYAEVREEWRLKEFLKDLVIC